MNTLIKILTKSGLLKDDLDYLLGTPGFPLSDVPLQGIAADVAAGRYRAKPSRVSRFEDIREAHRVMDANQAKGKMVVVI
jgi:hypothetical protein